MSQAVITKAFTEWKAQQAINNQPVTLDEFIFAYIPGLDPEKPISNTEAIPAADKIVHRQAVSKSGVVNGHSVVYSVTLGADVGDFNFNWIGLVNKATSTLAMIIHAPTQSKIKNASGQQGNVLVRSMLMEYSGAQAATQITTPAETWQIDFTARLAAMDERQRLENIDLYGAAAFFDTGYLVAKTGAQFYVTKGAGYVAGLRAELAANQNITVSTKPIKVWLDVSWSGILTSVWAVQSKITVAANLANYAESGVQHFVFALASIDASGNITDLRPKGTLNEQAANDALKAHEKSRNHPDATTKEKGFVQLSSETGSDDESKAATPKAVKAVNDDLTKVKENLGTASKADAVTSMTDTTAGRVPVVGWQGLGGSARDTNVSKETVASFWRDTAEVKSGITLPYDGSPTTNYFGVDGANHHAYIGRQKSGGGIAWVKLYSEFNKPTAADVDAVSASQGGTFQKGIAVKGNGATVALWPLAAGQSSYLLGKDYNGDNVFYFGRGSESYHVSLYNYKGNSGIILGWEGSVSLNPDVGKPVIVNNGPLKASTEIQSSSANSFRIAYGNYGTFWRNDGSNLYLMFTYSGDAWGGFSSLRPFTVNLPTGRVSIGHGLNVTGQVVPSDYGNFDALYQRKTATVIDVRQGSPGTIVLKRNGWNYVPGGCAFTGWYVEGDAPVADTIQYKPIQININGAWRTISG